MSKIGGLDGGENINASLKSNKDLNGSKFIRGHWGVKCTGPDGEIKWEDNFENIVVNQGLDYVLDVALDSGQIYGQLTSWYVGLASGSPVGNAADTMASHTGWDEFASYTEADRQRWFSGGVASQSVDNSASKADFSISVNGSTIGGAFLVSDNDKTGNSGTLYAVGPFSGGDKAADNGDTLSVTATFTSADDGV